MLPISLQLYTVRDQTAKDFPGTVRDIARIGYTGVELAGFGNLKSAGEVKRAVDDVGLKVSGMHVRLELLESELSKALDEAQLFGSKFVICPWMPEERRRDADGWRQVARSLNHIGRACRARGHVLCYHNHSFEFQRFTLKDPEATAVEANPPRDSAKLEKTGLDLLYDESDPELLKAELDTYWIKHGGVDPFTYINKLGRRVALLHLKDMARGSEQRFAPVGTGSLEFRYILAAAQAVGVEWNVVEQDNCYETPPIESLRISFENLRKLGAA